VAVANNDWIEIIPALIDWPFLLFIFLIVIVLLYREKIVGLLERGDIQISWGKDRHIKLKELSDGIDEELDPIRDEISELRNRIQDLEKGLHGEKAEQKNEQLIDDEKRYKDAEERIINGLKSHKYRWRSIERLANISGVSENETLDILRANSGVVLSRGKSGREIARMEDR